MEGLGFDVTMGCVYGQVLSCVANTVREFPSFSPSFLSNGNWSNLRGKRNTRASNAAMVGGRYCIHVYDSHVKLSLRQRVRYTIFKMASGLLEMSIILKLRT